MKPKVLLLSGLEDTGGGQIAIKQAFDRYAPDWVVRTVRTQDNYLHYPKDRQGPVPYDWLRETDIIFINSDGYSPKVFKQLPLGDKPLIVHHRGSHFRNDPETWATLTVEHGGINTCSTLDLTAHVEGVKWMGNIVDIERAEKIASQTTKPDKIRFVHAPTMRVPKGTPRFLEAVAEARQMGADFDVDLIERQPLLACLKRKARGHVLFDQIDYAYGSNALEAWAMGIPVMSGAKDYIIDAILKEVRYLPFHITTRENMAHDIQYLVQQEEWRTHLASTGRQYVNDYHHPKVMVEKWKQLFSEVLDR